MASLIPKERMIRPLAAALLVLAAAAFVEATGPGKPARSTVPVLVPFLLDEVRELGVIDAQVLVANVGSPTTTLALQRLRVISGGAALVDVSLESSLPGDPRYARAQELNELLPQSHADDRRWFSSPDAEELTGGEAVRARAEVDALVAQMRADYGAGREEPFAQISFPFPTDQVFFPEDLPGTRRTLRIVLEYRGTSGETHTVGLDHTIARLVPPLDPPASLKASTSIHAGDLHVHSCHGEAAGACSPSENCAAESFQLSGSFTYAQLKSQYQALGIDWFTATDHSYCINSDAEYATIVAECAALTDSNFIVIPDTELSSDEEGSQTGTDLADLLCIIGTTSSNHMGAHGIQSRKEGGVDGFLGFCDGLFDDVLEPFSLNASLIRAEGGYPIIHHPTDSSFGWNSVTSTQGIEAGSMHGVEIWNGETMSGQGGHVGQWVEWLLGGRILYAYSGSDTHDTAYAFGANHVLLDGPFTTENLEAALQAGRVFLSGNHQLILEVDLDGATLPMGALQSLAPGQPSSVLTLRAHYNFGADTSTITFFRGRNGDGAETVACTSPPLSGQGVFECDVTLDPFVRTWYRGYSEGSTDTAYTNPVFFLPGSCSYSLYGVGLGGANVGTLISSSSPTVGSSNTLRASGFSSGSALVFYAASVNQIPSGTPLLGGHLLIGPPFLFVGTGTLAAGQGSLTYSVPVDASVGASIYWQAAAIDPAQPAGFAFSNGLATTICDLLQ